MTATEQLKRQLDALPVDVREAEAARLLRDLGARVHERERETARRTRAARATDGLSRLSRRQTLGDDLTVRDLIEAGRRM